MLSEVIEEIKEIRSKMCDVKSTLDGMNGRSDVAE